MNIVIIDHIMINKAVYIREAEINAPNPNAI
jgi:hypothetical protein